MMSKGSMSGCASVPKTPSTVSSSSPHHILDPLLDDRCGVSDGFFGTLGVARQRIQRHQTRRLLPPRLRLLLPETHLLERQQLRCLPCHGQAEFAVLRPIAVRQQDEDEALRRQPSRSDSKPDLASMFQRASSSQVVYASK